MPPLPSKLRNQLEKAIVKARGVAEEAAGAALTTLAVERSAPFPSMSEEQRRLRRALRAKARQLGGGSQTAGMRPLVEEIAYQQWHRMLFARFLAENDLLMHTSGVSVTLQDCAELAPEEGAADAWDLAARYAARMLPGLFPLDDPTVQVRFAPEGRHALERILTGLPAAVFTSEDGLGWVYQFWQTQRKKEVNDSEAKIGAGTIGPVTQLFTEDYMVKFLLHNSLGAWWAARHPDSPLVQEFEYLRWSEAEQMSEDRSQTSAREGPNPKSAIRNPHFSFPGWPDTAAEVTVMDPAGGSGHFIVAAFEMLRKMRMEEEGLSAAEAGDAVIRDNLFMLEIDPRCTQIAAFNLLLAAWKSGGYRPLPLPHIACSGIAVEGQLHDWLKLACLPAQTGLRADTHRQAGEDDRLRRALERLYTLFRNAPTLGSLIDPTDVPLNERMFSADYEEVAPLLQKALARERQGDDPAAALLGAAARGAARAARLLAGKYTLVATNVPYLSRGKQGEILRDFCQAQAPEGKNDLATVFLDRCLDFCLEGGTTSIVLPQNWLFLTSYKKFREKLLQEDTWHLVARLGPGAFETISGEVVKAILITLSRGAAPAGHTMAGLDVSAPRSAAEKAAQLRTAEIKVVEQRRQLQNPDSRITLTKRVSGRLLQEYADSLVGIQTGDYPRFIRECWELPYPISTDWEKYQRPASNSLQSVDKSQLILWEFGQGQLYKFVVEKLGVNGTRAWLRGEKAWTKMGIAVALTRSLDVAIYYGEKYDQTLAVILPHNEQYLLPIWCFCSSQEFSNAVRRIDQKLNVTNATLVKVPFDLEHWQKVAAERYPDGLPEPWSNDPTQWLFCGHPAGSTNPLQVAVARLLGYHWPETPPPAPPQAGEGSRFDDLDQFADGDGIVCLSAVAGEQPASERLRALLAHAYTHPPALPDFERYRVGDFVPTTPVHPTGGWSPAVQEKLLAHAGFAGKSLHLWLRDGFFKQHVKLFKNRPFIWHIWDGRKDGFHALVNTHKLDAARLDKLIYTYLGAWINDQRAARDAGEPGAEGRLVAALELKRKLELIRDGEPPYDITIRWKPLHQQPIGWNPDLNDGVRLNIRPFVIAGVLRRKFSIHWKKDRGKNPDGSERLNDLHFTRAEKLAAREVR